MLKYLKSTSKLGIKFDGNKPVLAAFSDSDFAACRDTRRSTTGLVVKNCGGPVAWRSTRQSTVAESTAEAEFVACSSASREVMWLRQFSFEVVGKPLLSPTTIYVDNQATIKLITNNQVRSKTKHLDIRLMAVRERCAEKAIKPEYVSTDMQQAYLFTKPLPPAKFTTLRSKLGLSLVLFLLCLVIPARTYRLSLGMGPDFTQPTMRLVIKVNNPCSQVVVAENILRGKVFLSPEAKANTSIIETTRELCQSTFNKSILTALDEINGCQTPNRAKRDLSTIISVATTVSSFIVGVTNFIRGFSESANGVTRRDVIKQLASQVNLSTVSLLTDRSIMAVEEERELDIISSTARMHLEAIRQETAHIPMVLWSSFQAMHELYAGAANLRAVKLQCRAGVLATQEIGEMVESTEIGEVSAAETSVVSMIYDPDVQELEILYRLKKALDFNTENVIAVPGVVVVLAFAIMLIRVNLAALHAIRRTPSAPVAVPRHNKGHLSVDF